MRRHAAIAVALFCVLAQLGLGVSATLGLVFCIGDDHARIELATADCCAAHGAGSRPGVTAAADDGCADIPLVTAVRSASESPRGQAAFAPPATAAATVVSPDGARCAGPAWACDAVPPPSALVRRSVVLRV